MEILSKTFISVVAKSLIFFLNLIISTRLYDMIDIASSKQYQVAFQMGSVFSKLLIKLQELSKLPKFNAWFVLCSADVEKDIVTSETKFVL